MTLTCQVYEAEDGSLQNVPSAISRSKTLTCTKCGARGATIGCCHSDCPANYHLHCAMEARADFKEDKTVYCYAHAQKYAVKENVESMEVSRCVWVDLETDRNKKSKFVDFRKLQFSLGSVHVENLGSIVPLPHLHTKNVSFYNL